MRTAPTLIVLKPGQIPNSRQKFVDVFIEQAQSRVAPGAKQATHLASAVIVVDRQSLRFAESVEGCFWLIADQAQTVLLVMHQLIVIACHPVLGFQMRLVALL
jgi:hypothetical protein